ncbi:NAD(P)H-hydrate dehydratase [Mitsuaria sp. WAJ17]|uniref:NAD(P)H-hydrate dehydratase n=1 Tax=Mitsuaria sp. WAJ17 TaxID=2761452 RepID=UPI0016005A01|nr:NAD(P)H-hydrate dehydratase [Mitsuaria sp. WAJ17]MBB2483930.1 NAD(P)H-hydrate dehydratase [Mitsuaria sp. WAJ17]
MIEVLHQAGRFPLFSSEGCRALEAASLARSPAQALMARAGLAVARLALAVAPHARRVWIACGPGNNGGDGLVAARHLASLGLEVHVSHLCGSKPLPADAQWAWRTAMDAGLRIGSTLQPPEGCELVIDALLGLGLQRAPEAALEQAILAINACDVPVLSIDLPSGLQADAGRPCPDALGRAGAVVRAQHTLCLLGLKPGLFTGQGRDHAGRIWFDDLGVSAADGDCGRLVALGERQRWQALARRTHASHKGSYGQVLVIGGAAHMEGAALLAAGSALAAGAGKVHLKPLSGAVHAGGRPELMRWPEGPLDSQTPWQDLTLVVGCGAGHGLDAGPATGSGSPLPEVLRQAPRLVLDADGLNSVARSGATRELLHARRSAGRQTILTPHPLEAARLLAWPVAQVQADRLVAARALSATLDCSVVLKGSGSVIASPGEPLHVNGSGNAALAGAGTGDVLAGWLGGLWAQRPDLPPHEIATMGVAWHGEAAQGAQAPLRAADLIERMHALQACLP